MPSLIALADYGSLLDAAAIVCSAALMIVILRKRQKSGRREGSGEAMDFANEMTSQIICQQSRKAYANLQRSLAREFESLGMLDSGPPDVGGLPRGMGEGLTNRRRAFGLAEQMISRGEDKQKILDHCGLLEGEVELLLGLHQLAKGTSRATGADRSVA